MEMVVINSEIINIHKFMQIYWGFDISLTHTQELIGYKELAIIYGKSNIGLLAGLKKYRGIYLAYSKYRLGVYDGKR